MKKGDIVEIMENIDGMAVKYFIATLTQGGDGFQSEVRLPSEIARKIGIGPKIAARTSQLSLLPKDYKPKFMIEVGNDILFSHYDGKKIVDIIKNLQKVGINTHKLNIFTVGDQLKVKQKIEVEDVK